MNYPVKWLPLPKFCEITGMTPAQIRQLRCRGVWPETLCRVTNGRLWVNIQEYDRWVEAA